MGNKACCAPPTKDDTATVDRNQNKKNIRRDDMPTSEQQNDDLQDKSSPAQVIEQEKAATEQQHENEQPQDLKSQSQSKIEHEEEKEPVKELTEEEKVAQNEDDVKAQSTFMADRYVKFEGKLPFAKTMIFGYEKNLKEAAARNEGENKDFVTIANLRLELITEAWAVLEDSDSTLVKILNDPYLKYEWEDDYEGERVEGALDVQKLQLLGLLWCQGEDKEKAEAFWSVLQDQDQDFIASSDKDYKPAIEILCHLATLFEIQTSRDHAEVKCEYTDEEFTTIEESFEGMLDTHLDELFDYQSKLTKDEWILQIGEKTPYVFSAAKLRKKVLAEADLKEKY